MVQIESFLEENIISARFIITMALVIGYLAGLTTDVTLIGMAIAFWFGSKAATGNGSTL